ncbi:MAG TPA: UDP-N-acetylglucosamine 4,6-dehydratase (inverting) [Abditibacterium sp.]|jgi:UDP-N-acetylglucosamine 4,6-dehydratase
MMDWRNKVVLLTGGTGSFGRKFIEVVRRDLKPKKVIVFSRDELKQHEMRVAGFDGDDLRYFIGDVRDADRLRRAMQGVDIVVHAAALKQVPACEYNPFEAILTNVNGAKNVIDASIDAGVKQVLALSTDKAVSPVNLYGATKLCAEKLFVHGNVYSGEGGTRFSCVRYGNVVGSRGSVIPLFLKQKETGQITVTDARMTRFWITLDQGVKFVLDSIEKMRGGEVFVPKIPSMNILDLAKAIAPDISIRDIGIRPGEKLHESLVSEDEARAALEFERHFEIYPAGEWTEFSQNSAGKILPDGFSYSSDNNAEQLSVEELREFASLEK